MQREFFDLPGFSVGRYSGLLTVPLWYDGKNWFVRSADLSGVPQAIRETGIAGDNDIPIEQFLEFARVFYKKKSA